MRGTQALETPVSAAVSRAGRSHPQNPTIGYTAPNQRNDTCHRVGTLSHWHTDPSALLAAMQSPTQALPYRGNKGSGITVRSRTYGGHYNQSLSHGHYQHCIACRWN